MDILGTCNNITELNYHLDNPMVKLIGMMYGCFKGKGLRRGGERLEMVHKSQWSIFGKNITFEGESQIFVSS